MFTKNNVYLFTVTINSFFNSTYHPNILLKVPFLIFLFHWDLVAVYFLVWQDGGIL